jgi:uroporphyrin-III C-methyltransferase/precorrin-2 dehydrogenase/sirohydrochlorin ferrochelatase
VLEWVGADVEIVDVGKSGGDHPVSQAEINQILVDRALLGKKVVRLKGGDPYVFGRGGEELDACRAAGVPVTVIPGISSAVAVPAAAGIPVTHRGISRGFSVVTAHSQLGTLPPVQDHTLVQGNPGDTPCAIVEDGFGPRQRTTIASLETLAQRAAEAGVMPPAITVIGDVVLRADVLRDSLDALQDNSVPSSH